MQLVLQPNHWETSLQLPKLLERDRIHPAQHVPLVRGGDDDVVLSQKLQISPRLPGQDYHLQPQQTELGMSVSVAVVCQGILWRDIHTPPLGIVRKQPEDGHLCTDCLATASSNKDIVVRIVDGVEDLGLDRVELCESLTVQVLVLLVPEGSHRQGLQVQQHGRWRVFLRKQKVSE